MVRFGFNFSLNGLDFKWFGLAFFKWFGLNGWEFINGLVWFLFYINGSVRFQGKETEPGPLLFDGKKLQWVMDDANDNNLLTNMNKFVILVKAQYFQKSRI